MIYGWGMPTSLTIAAQAAAVATKTEPCRICTPPGALHGKCSCEEMCDSVDCWVGAGRLRDCPGWLHETYKVPQFAIHV